MSTFQHLQILGSLEDQKRILDVLNGLKPWLQGNAKATDADENGIIPIWTEQIDQATSAVRRLIYEGCAQYALIQTTRSAETPQNLPFAIYTALQVSDAPAVDGVILSPAQSIWVEQPALLGGGMTFLIVQPIYPTRILLTGRSMSEDDESVLDLHKLVHDVRWYKGIIRSNKLDYVCPSCKKGYHERFQLAEHFKKSTESEADNERHKKLRMIKRNGDWRMFVQGMEESLGPIQAQSLRDGSSCFEESFLRQISYKAYCCTRHDTTYQGECMSIASPESYSLADHQYVKKNNHGPDASNMMGDVEFKDCRSSRRQASTIRTRCS